MLLTSKNKSAYNVPVLTKKVSIGIGTPIGYTGARRPSICRLCGFFVRSSITFMVRPAGSFVLAVSCVTVVPTRSALPPRLEPDARLSKLNTGV